MSAKIRVKRILSKLAAFEVPNDPSASGEGQGMGSLLGAYLNSADRTNTLLVFDGGIIWHDSVSTKSFRYGDVTSVTLPDGKESLSLIVTTCHSERLNMPVYGNDGKYFDSMQMLRFLNRVVEDIRHPIA